LYIQIAAVIVHNREEPTDENGDKEGCEKMADDGSDFEYLSPASFEWDDQKRELNLAKHASISIARLKFSMDRSFFANRIATMRSAGPL
jgi:hypothetical protein